MAFKLTMNSKKTASQYKRNEASARRAANAFGERRAADKPLDLRGVILHDGTSERSNIDYRAYLQTRHWRIVRKMALHLAHYHCGNCGGAQRLRVHHLTYENLWHEYSNDVTVLCDDCHNLLHGLYL